jgi:threonine aldolase
LQLRNRLRSKKNFALVATRVHARWAVGKVRAMTTVDLRSDTVTRPTAGMREAMLRAPVGDDVFGEDPTVNALEQRVAALLGKQAALFASSGTMANQLAIACSTRPGDEVVVGEGAHVAFYEVGAAAALSGVQFAIAGAGGFFDAGELDAACKPQAYYYPRTSLVCLENTHNRSGGRVLAPARIQPVAERAKAHGLAVHLDGARVWNASIALGIDVGVLAAPFDTVSVCFSKGLGAPVGSMLVGSAELVLRARRLRKMWGGGMRQVGMLAAAAMHALDHHVERLADDHRRAKALAAGLAKGSGMQVTTPDTNIVLVSLPCPAAEVVGRARSEGVLVSEWAETQLRLVTHLDVDDAGIERAISVLRTLVPA